MLHEKLAEKLRGFYSKLNALSNEIAFHIDNIEKKGDPDLSLYITQMKKCHIAFKKTLDVLKDSSEFYKKDLEIRDSHNSLDYIRHDLLNPISGIKGYSEIILEENTDLYTTSNINEIISITNGMLDLISQISFYQN